MLDALLYRKTVSQTFTPDTSSLVPEALHERIAAETRALIRPVDFVNRFSETPDFNVGFQDFSFEHLTHQIFAKLLDPAASELTYFEIVHRDDVFYGLMAEGGNPTGFILSSTGEKAFEITDGMVREADSTAYLMTPLETAVHGVVFFADAGQSVEDVSDQIKQRDEKNHAELFG